MKRDYTDEELIEIGRNIIEKQEEKSCWVESMKPQWKREGKALRNLRQKLDVHRCYIANKLDISDGVLYRLENGDQIKRRKMVRASYKSVLELIMSQRELALAKFTME